MNKLAAGREEDDFRSPPLSSNIWTSSQTWVFFVLARRGSVLWRWWPADALENPHRARTARRIASTRLFAALNSSNVGNDRAVDFLAVTRLSSSATTKASSVISSWRGRYSKCYRINFVCQIGVKKVVQGGAGGLGGEGEGAASGGEADDGDGAAGEEAGLWALLEEVGAALGVGD